jgi:D-alanine--D-alanine ligase
MVPSAHSLGKKRSFTGSIQSTEPLRVGVLMGGRSLENEVSFNSGRTICDHLDTNKYEIIPLYQTNAGKLYILPWHFLHRGKTTDFESRLQGQACCIKWDDLKELIDFMYIATHGRYAEDGTLQGFLEILGIPYLGAGVYASALRMDKIKHKKVLAAQGITVPAHIPVYAHQLADHASVREYVLAQMEKKNIHFPCIVKPHNQGSSIGVSQAHTLHELLEAIYMAAAIEGVALQSVVIEEKIVGMEFACITLIDYKQGGYISLPPTEIVIESDTHVYDYEQKYMPGRATKHTPARCTAETIQKIQSTCIRVMEILEFSAISRIDGFVTWDDKIVIIDPNSLTGMGPSSFLFLQAAKVNMSHTLLINHLIETELYQYGMLTNNDNILSYGEGMPSHKIRVAVLMGGRSHEKEISLESGRNVTYKLSPHRYEAIPIFVSNSLQLFKIDQSLLVRSSTAEIESLVDESMRIDWNDLPTIADFVFIALHGGEGENGCVQGALEMLGMAYNGSGVFTSALCMNKYKTNELLQVHAIAVPVNMLIAAAEWALDLPVVVDRIVNKFFFPLIVKPHDDGCSVMVQKVKTVEQLIDAINMIFKDGKTHAMIEEFISGTELTVGVIGNDHAQALPPSQCVTTEDILTIEEKFLPGAGENQTPALLPSEVIALVQRTMEQAYVALKCKGYVRIDCFYQNAVQSPTAQERVVIIEINTLPGLTPATCLFHQAAEIGMRPMEFIDHIVQLGFELHKKSSPDIIASAVKQLIE